MLCLIYCTISTSLSLNGGTFLVCIVSISNMAYCISSFVVFCILLLKSFKCIFDVDIICYDIIAYYNYQFYNWTNVFYLVLKNCDYKDT